MAHYSFTTYWKLEAPLEEVALAIADVERWPEWWRAVRNVEVVKNVPTNNKVGSIYAHTWRSALPYDLHFTIELTEVIPFQLLRGHAEGDLEGEGLWTLSHANGVTTAQYDWNVRTTKLWMNLVAPVGRPIFKWAHDWVMNQGETGLRRELARRTQPLEAKQQKE